MPSMTAYNFGDVILVPFPFTDQSQAKQRPAVVVSSARYNTERPDLILMAITAWSGCARRPPSAKPRIVQHWQAAKLLKPSAIKPVFTTLDKRLVRKSLGRLRARRPDRAALKAAVQLILGLRIRRLAVHSQRRAALAAPAAPATDQQTLGLVQRAAGRLSCTSAKTAGS